MCHTRTIILAIVQFAWEGVGRLQTWLRHEYDGDAGHQCLLALQLDALYFVDWALVVIFLDTVKQSYLQGRASSVSNVAFSLDLPFQTDAFLCCL